MSLRALLLALFVLGCSSPPAAIDASAGPTSFAAPQGIALHTRFAVVTNSAFSFDAKGDVVFGQGFVSLIDRETLVVVGRVNTTQKNPQEVVVDGDRAYVLNGGVTRIDTSGVVVAAEGGGIDVFDLNAGVPAAPLFNIPLGLSTADTRIGAYGSLALSPDGRRAFVGSGTRADLLEVDLEARSVVRGPERPIVVSASASGENGMTVVRSLRDKLAILSFNDDALCLADFADVSVFSCRSIGVEKELLEGPVDLAQTDDGQLLLLMTLANALYALDGSGASATLQAPFAGTGLAANAVRVRGRRAYVVNSLSHTLQRVSLDDGASESNFAAFEVGANPYALALDESHAWVTLLGHDQVARVALDGGAIQYVREVEAADGGSSDGAQDGGMPGDATPSIDAGCDAPQIIGASEVLQVTIGAEGGHNEDALPQVVLGGPTGGGNGGGNVAGVLSLGREGEVVLGFGPYRVVDGPGPDLIVFENPFLLSPYQSFCEPAIVSLSDALTADSFVEFPCDLAQPTGDADAQRWPYPGCAGVRPVFANVETGCVAADDPLAAGGDAFDLADLGLSEARYVRIRDAGVVAPAQDGTAGFDLDAVVLINYRRVDP